MEEIKEERLAEELQHASISLVLDTYDDIFSDFDPRPFAERAMSDDFLLECKKASHDIPEGGIQLLMSIPRDKRSINDEIKIKKRLKEHFKKHFLEKQKDINKIKKDGMMWVGIGILILIGVVYGMLNVSNTFFEALITILEIPSWFLVWEGMGKIFIDSKKLEGDYQFYKKMASVQIIFRSY